MLLQPADWSCVIPASLLCGPGDRRRRRTYHKRFQKLGMHKVSMLPLYCQTANPILLSFPLLV